MGKNLLMAEPTDDELQQFAMEMLQDENFLGLVKCNMELAMIRSEMGEQILKIV